MGMHAYVWLIGHVKLHSIVTFQPHEHTHILNTTGCALLQLSRTVWSFFHHIHL